MRLAVALASALLLAACGQVAPLRPKAGVALPPKPDNALTTPTPDDLLRPSDQARPRRNDELLQNSEQRKPDRFDLPPPG